MENIRISDNIKVFIEHAIFGKISMGIDGVEVVKSNDASRSDKTLVHFSKVDSRGAVESMTLDITIAMSAIVDHVHKNNLGAVGRAKECGNPNPDRYIVRDMCVEEILFEGDYVRLYCTWLDCYDCRRLYMGQRCTIKPAYRGDKDLFLYCYTPTFYF